MPRQPTPIPQIAAVPRELTVEAVREIVELAERAVERRQELRREMRTALATDDRERVVALAREFALGEREEEESLPPAA